MAVEIGDKVTADLLDENFTKVLARARRTADSDTFTNAETGLLRIDDIPVLADHVIRIIASCVQIDTTVAGDVAEARIRVQNGGTTAGTTSARAGFTRMTLDSATHAEVQPAIAYYYPTVDDTLSVLLSGVRMSGTGQLTLIAHSGEPLDLVVEDLGLDVGDTGVVLHTP